ncbi:MAG TPA: amidohydrolase family protein, partial [Kofleriaceae bacterium]|nr:amidohydrolase family protein [Kofleriaceae bacterium]
HGMAILPGLWDMHAHVEQVEQAAVYLGAGVTTVRDLGNILDFITGVRDAIEAGKGLGPRIIVDGLVDGDGEGSLGKIRINSRADIPKVIDQLRAAGCAEVKIYSSITPELVKPIAAYAHAHGMRVVGHIPAGMKSLDAIAAGFDSISHMGYLRDVFPDVKDPTTDELWGLISGEDLGAPEFRHMLDVLVAHHIVIDDTLALIEPFFFPDADYARREPGVATMPAELPPFNGLEDGRQAAAAARAFESYLDMIRRMHARGVTLVAGTDIAVPGHSVHRELELYVMAGFTPMEAIQAATIVPARYMHRDKELGTIEVGKRADLVVVAGNPLANIGDIRKTKLVVARGRVYESDALWKLAGFRRLAN